MPSIEAYLVLEARTDYSSESGSGSRYVHVHNIPMGEMLSRDEFLCLGMKRIEIQYGIDTIIHVLAYYWGHSMTIIA